MNKSSKLSTGNPAQGRAALRTIKPFDLIALASLVIILIIFTYAGYFTREYMVNVSKVCLEYPHDVYAELTANGQVAVGHTVCISPRISGRLAGIRVNRGDIVKKGQVVATLDTADDAALRDQTDANLDLANANLEQARLTLNEALANHGRSRGLFTKGSMREAQYRASEAQLRKAKTALHVAEATVRSQSAALRVIDMRLRYSRVLAPFDGIVLSRNAYPGDAVRPLVSDDEKEGSILTLADLSALQVEVEVPEYETDSVRAGQPCSIVIDSFSTRLSGQVDSVTPPAREDKTTSTVRIGFAARDRRILPDMKAGVAFLLRQVRPAEDKPLIVVERSSLIPTKKGYSAFLMKDEKAVEKYVRIGRQFSDKVEVLEGLKTGDLLVTNPPDGIRNGSRIVVSRF